mmetsp:Transcript_34034/g.47158  ORF Transcript_34034/g.47158 Transcript_34034/m.47158 type:complete len:253 (+) Transcript_34034:110-868(+)
MSGHQSFAFDQEAVLYEALSAPLSTSEMMLSGASGAASLSERRAGDTPLLSALQGFHAAYPSNPGALALLRGMWHWLRRQLADKYIWQWSLPREVFTQGGGGEYTRDSVRLMRVFFRTHFNVPSLEGNLDKKVHGVPARLVFSLPLEYSDREVKRIVSWLKGLSYPGNCAYVGEVKINYNITRPVWMISHTICCFGEFFCIPCDVGACFGMSHELQEPNEIGIIESPKFRKTPRQMQEVHEFESLNTYQNMR